MSYDILTYADLIEHLVDHTGGAQSDKDLRDIKRAIQSAYTEVASASDWDSNETKRRFYTNASYSTGTIEYTSSTRTITLTGGTFPAFAARGYIKIADIFYQIDALVSGTSLRLNLYNAPSGNIASGTSYEVFEGVVVLPSDTRAVRNIYDSLGAPLCEFSYDEWLECVQTHKSAGEPTHYAIANAYNRLSNPAVYLWPMPNTATYYDLVCQVYPAPLRINGTETASTTGTVSTTANSNAVTGGSTAFASSMEGCVIRVSPDGTNAPTSLSGTNPYVEEAVILNVSSTTALTTDRVFTQSLSNVKYQIASRVDLDAGTHEALLRSCELQLAILRRELDKIGLSEDLYRRALIRAKENNARSLGPKRALGPTRHPAGFTVTTHLGNVV